MLGPEWATSVMAAQEKKRDKEWSKKIANEIQKIVKKTTDHIKKKLDKLVLTYCESIKNAL